MTRSLLACFLLPRSRVVVRLRIGPLAVLVAPRGPGRSPTPQRCRGTVVAFTLIDRLGRIP